MMKMVLYLILLNILHQAVVEQEGEPHERSEFDEAN